MIRPYSIHRTDKVITGFELTSAFIIGGLLGALAVMTVNSGLDSYICDFGRGEVTSYFNGSKWRRD